MTYPCLVSETCDAPLFGKRVFADVIKLRLLRGGHPGLSGWVLRSMINVLKRDKREDTQQKHAGREEKPGEDGGRAWSDAASSQGTPGITR